jgi:hypothetical protein
MRPVQTLLLAAALLAAAWAHAATQVPANVQVLTVDMEPGYADRATISGDGRFVAFPYRAVANPTRQIYMQDRLTGERRLVSRGTDGSPGSADSDNVMLTRAGHYLFFMSRAPNLGVPASGYGLFRYDWDHDKLEALLVTPAQGFTYLGYSESYPPSPTADGSQVFFLATNAGTTGIYKLDVATRTTALVIQPPANWGLTPARHMASADGRYLAYLRTPQASDGQTRTEAYVYDRTSATQQLINVSYTGDLATAVSPNTAAKDLNVSDDGQVAAFSSQSTLLLYPAKSSPSFDAYVRDLTAGATSQLSTTSTTTNTQFPALSGDGRIAAFIGIGKNSQQGGLWTWDRRSGVEKLIIAGSGTAWPDLNSDGRYLVFFLYAVPGSSHNYDLAVADLGPPPGLSVTPTTLAATEGGLAATYSIALTTPPGADVTVTVSQSAQYTSSASRLTFTNANWNTPQVVSVSAVLDGKTEGNQAVTIANTASSSDPDYQGLPATNVTLNITDTVVPTLAVAGSAGVWNLDPLAVTGTAAPNATVVLTIHNSVTGDITAVSATADTNGNWSSSVSGLADGSYDLQADASGIKSTTLSIRVDSHAPVSTLALASTATKTTDGWYSAPVTATLVAADGTGLGIQRSEYTLDNGAWTAFPTAGLNIATDASHTLCYRSVDKAGNVETARCTAVAVDQGAPMVATSFAQAANTLTLTASDTVAGIRLTETSVDNGTTWTTYSAPLAFTKDGSVTVMYRATDKAGNVKAGQISIIVTTPPLVTAPPPQSAQEASSAAISLGSFSDADPTGSWTVDVDWGDGSPHASFIPSAPGSLGALNHTYGDSSAYTVTVKVTDQGGSAGSKTFAVNVANVAPTAGFSAPATAFVGGTATLSFSNAADVSAADVHAGLRFAFACDGAALGGATYQSAGTAATATCQYTAPGMQTVRARVYDKDNGYTEYTASISVLVPVTLDPIPGPWTQSALPAGGTAAANAAVQVVFTNSSTNVATTVNATADAQGKWSATANALPDGSYQVLAQSGGFGTTPVALTIDWHAPVSAVSLSAASPASAAGWYNGAVTATVSAADPSGGTGVARIEYALDGGSHTALPAGGVQVATDGQHSFCYRAADNAGNVETAHCTAIAIDTAAPQASASFDANANNLTISASDTGAGVQSVQYSTDNGATWTAYTGAVHFAHDGNVTVQYRALDKAGNTGAGQLAFNVATPPIVAAPAAQTANEGASTTFALGSFSDADPASTWSVDVDWGDGSAHGAASVGATGSLGFLAHSYADNGSYTATVSVTDANGSTGSRSFPVSVANVAPTAQLSVPASSIAGTNVAVTLVNGADASAADAAALRYVFACDGASLAGASYATASASNTANCVYVAAGAQAIRARVFDKDGGYTEYTGSTTVNVVAQDVTAGTGTASSALNFEQKGHTYSGTVTITNNTALPYPGPIYVIFEGLNTKRVRMDNASGTYNGDYYVMLQVGSLQPGASQTFPVTLWNPSDDNMNYTLRIYAGKLP